MNNLLNYAIAGAAFFALAGCFYKMWRNATDYPSNYDEDLTEYRNSLMEGKRNGKL